MTQLSIASGAGLAFGLATLVATLCQCGNGRAAEPERSSTMSAATRPQEPKPQPAASPPPDALRLLISGSMLGRLEPCGCASGQLGGLARRMQHIGEQRNYDLLLEGGDLVGGNTELDVLKLFTASTVLFQMERGYDALGVGLRDLAVPQAEWRAFLGMAPVVATNLRCEQPDWPAKPFVDKTVRGHQVRIASLLLDELPNDDQLAAAQIERTDPTASWQQAFGDAPKATFRIALLHGHEAQVRALLPSLTPPPDLAIGVAADYVEPTTAPTTIGQVPLVFAGIRGRVLLDARLWRTDEGAPRIACEAVPLPASKTLPGGGGDPQVKDVLLEHRRTVKELGVLANMAEQRPTPSGNAYVGSATCQGCHPSAYKAWQASKHAHAWQTLVDAEQDPKRYGWPVTAYPDCVGCHVIGYGEKSGFVSHDATPHLENVGCERCHGPGSAHVMSGGQKQLGIIGGERASVMCTQCHDFEQSPDFVYTDRWAVIEHGREPNQRTK